MSVGEHAADSGLDREKWEIERAFREREVAVKEAELELKRQQQIDSGKAEVEKALRKRELSAKEAELELKRKEDEASGWRSPLVVAIFAATLAAAGNAAIAIVNGWEERNLERQKSEETRILEIKTSSPDKAAENLGFLLKAGLVDNTDRANKIQKFLDSRAPGTGPTLPATSVLTNAPPDEAIDAAGLPAASQLRNSAQSVGELRILGKGNLQYSCTAFLIGKDLALTAAHCLQEGAIADLVIGSNSFRVEMPPAVMVSGMDENYAIFRVNGAPGIQYAC